MSKAPVRVAVTGAAGQIGYSLLFRIASGEMLGKDQPVILQLLEIPDEKAQKALKGVMMELDDCAFPLLHGMVAAADPMVAFKDIEVALLVGARPRGPGMERKDLSCVCVFSCLCFPTVCCFHLLWVFLFLFSPLLCVLIVVYLFSGVSLFV